MFRILKVSVLMGILLWASGPAVHSVLGAPLERVANTTLALPPAPPQFGYSLASAFPGLSVSEPVAIVQAPGETNRLFILEKRGNIIVITNLASPRRTVFMNLTVAPEGESGLLGLAFHPGYATNRYFYVFSSRNLNTSQGNGRHQRLSRFEISPQNPNQGLPGTEQPLITQWDTANNHNGGDLHFGPDGYLYVSLGDEGPQYDGGNHSQTITKHFFSAILRLDVDKRPGNLLPNPHRANTTNYFVPADNPYVGATSFNGRDVNPNNVRTEFYAVGFRNPWRMSFDPVTGALWVGDVGQDAWEEVDIVVKGGNYGWVFRDGLQAGFRTPTPGFTHINPIHQYAHGNGPTRGNSVTGGLVYRGTRLSQLYGAYIFADYTSGNVWMLRQNGTNVVPSQRLTGSAGPVAFGADPRNGDILIAQLNGQILRLNYNATATGMPLPPTLAETGAFADLASLKPHPGIVPYELNLPFWSDGALKTRWFSIPDIAQTIRSDSESPWSFPPGSVWVKHFELELTNGLPASRRRIETRFIVQQNSGVYGATYRWDEAQANATLVPEAGLDEDFVMHEGATVRTQTWRYPSRAECLVCHNTASGGVLGFNAPQLQRDIDYGQGAAHQLQALSQAGYFSPPLAAPQAGRGLASLTDQSASLESRVRSYLAANCANCHRPGGPSVSLFDARLETPTALAGLVHGRLSNPGENEEFRVVRPGSPELSMLWQRISTRGPKQMPPLASAVVDSNAVQLVADWIQSEATLFQPFEAWQAAKFPDPKAPAAAPMADPDTDLSSNYLEYLLGTEPETANAPWSVSARLRGGKVEIRFPQAARRGYELQWTRDPLETASWRPLDAAGNVPHFSAAPREAVLEDVIESEPKFYRVRIFEN